MGGGGTGALSAYDIALPTHEILNERYVSLGGAIVRRSLAVQWPYAFLAGPGAQELCVVDVAGPSRSLVTSCTDFTDIQGVALLDATHLCVADGAANTRIVDISVPSAPIITETIATPAPALSVAFCVEEGRICAACGTAGLFVVDRSTGVGHTVDTTGIARHVVDVGSQAYVADGSGGVAIVAVDSVGSTLTGACDTPGDARRLALAGIRVFVADGSGGFQVIDAVGVVASYPYAFVADSRDDIVPLKTFELIPERPQPHAETSTGEPSYAVGLAAPYLFVETSQTLNILRLDSMQKLGEYHLEGGDNFYFVVARPPLVFVSYGDFMYGQSSSHLDILDLSDPSTPLMVSRLDFEVAYQACGAIQGDLMHVVGMAGYRVYDLSDPAEPRLLSTLSLPGYGMDVVARGDNVFLGAWSGGLQVVDVPDPMAPRLVGGCDVPGLAIAVRLRGDFAYVATIGLPSSIAVVDISRPATPTPVAFVGTVGTPGISCLWLDGQYLHLVNEGGGYLEVIDCADPLQPTVTARLYGASALFSGVAVSGRYAYLSVRRQAGTAAELRDAESLYPSGASAAKPFGVADHAWIPYDGFHGARHVGPRQVDYC